MKRERRKDLLVFLIILLFNVAYMLSREIVDLDELWNYNFARNISNGLLPYADFNFIVAPLYPAIESIFLKLIANQLIVSRILGAIVFTVIMFMGHKILDNLTENKLVHIPAILGVLFIYKDWFWSNYNFGVLLITMLVMYLEIKHIKDEKWNYSLKYELFVGMLVGTAVITKQTTGAMLAFTFIMYRWLFIAIEQQGSGDLTHSFSCVVGQVLIRKKSEIRNAVRISIMRGIGAVIPILIFMAYLLVTSTFNEFIDYTIKGLATEFTSTFPYIDLLRINGISAVIKWVAVLLPVALFCGFVTLWRTKSRKLGIMLVFSVQSMIIMYPLCDPAHFLIGVFPMVITTIYLLCHLMEKHVEIEKYNKVLIGVTGVVMLLCTGVGVGKLVQYCNENTKEDMPHFAGVPISEGLYVQTRGLANYVLNKENEGIKAYILDMEAVLTMITADRYNKHYDLLVKANFGAKGEEGIIEDIKKEENAVFLVKPGESYNRQSAEKVRNFVKENFELVEENVWGYNVYRNKM